MNRTTVIFYFLIAIVALMIGFQINPERVMWSPDSERAGKLERLRMSDRGRSMSGRDDFQTSQGPERWLRVIERLEKANLEDLPGIAVTGSNNRWVTQMIFERWFELDPQHLLETCLKQMELKKSGEPFFYPDLYFEPLFERWPIEDLPAALAAMENEGNFPILSDYTEILARSMAEVNPLEALRLGKRLGDLSLGGNAPGTTQWMVENPRGAADTIFDEFDQWDDMSVLNDDPFAPGVPGQRWLNSLAEIWTRRSIRRVPFLIWKRCQAGSEVLFWRR
jgi:hypothetical protein